MATSLTSWPFSGAGATSETQFSQLFGELAGPAGVADGPSGPAFAPSVTGSDMVVHIAAGFAIVRGFACLGTGGVNDKVTINTAHATLQRYDLIVLQLDPTNNLIDILYVPGTAGAGAPPALTQTTTGIYQMPLCQVLVNPGVTTITSGNISNIAPCLNTKIGNWRTSNQKPVSPRMGQFGITNGQTIEYYDGTQWIDLRDLTSAQLSDIRSDMLANGTAKSAKGMPVTLLSVSATYRAVWSDAFGNFGTNTSSERFKENIQDHEVDPDAVLALQPRSYDRIDGSATGEYGLIAEEVDEHLPEIVLRDADGQIESVRYDLLAVALLDVVKRQQAQIDGLHEVVQGLMAE